MSTRQFELHLLNLLFKPSDCVKLFEKSERRLNFRSPTAQFIAVCNLAERQNLDQDQSQTDIWRKLPDRGIIIDAIF